MSVIPPAIKAAITNFGDAAQQYAFKGAAHPEDVPAIVHQYENARQNLERAIEKAISK